MPRVHRIASLLKRWILGTHQGAVAPRHLPYYLDEFTFRFNRRKSKSRGKLFYRLMQQAVEHASGNLRRDGQTAQTSYTSCWGKLSERDTHLVSFVRRNYLGRRVTVRERELNRIVADVRRPTCDELTKAAPVVGKQGASGFLKLRQVARDG